ncbi:MAG TPA: DUF3185 family protein [Planctomycetota bacterium]|nr:DUF3185 family protein [Planctomycetota bacterium]
MKSSNAILLVVTGVILLIGGLLASTPDSQQPSETLTRIPPGLAPWLLIGGGLVGLLGLVSLIGVFPPHFLQTRRRPAERPEKATAGRTAGPARRLLDSRRSA